MTLEEINKALEDVKNDVKKLDLLSTEDIEKNIDNIGEKIDKLIDSDNGITFEEGIDFESFIKSNLDYLNQFDYDAYLDKLYKNNKKMDVTAKEGKATEREEKVNELISKISRIGNLNTVIKNLNERYKSLDIEKVMEEEDKNSGILKENEENKKRDYLIFGKNIEDDLKKLDAIKERIKLEKEITDLDKQITDLKNDVNNATNPKTKDYLNRKINLLEKGKNDKEHKKTELEKVTGTKTEDDIRKNMEGKIPSGANKTTLEDVVKSDDPRKALDDLIKGCELNISIYQNRTNKYSDRISKIREGKDVRKEIEEENNRVITPEELKKEAEKYKEIKLTEEEMKAIDDYIKDEENKDEIDKLREKIKDDQTNYPVPENLIKDTLKWLNEERGETKNPFKKAYRQIQSRLGKTQDAYKMALMEKNVKEYFIDKKKKENYEKEKKDKQDKINQDRASKTKTLDEFDLSFKQRIQKMAKGLNNEELKNIVDEGKYGKIAHDQLHMTVQDQNSKDDDEYLK